MDVSTVQMQTSAVLLKAVRRPPDAAVRRTTTVTSDGKMPANLAAVGDVNINKL